MFCRSVLYAAALVCTFAWTQPATAAQECSAKGISNAYDVFLKAAAHRHLPPPYRDNWCLLKAQCYIESRLKASAVSPAGAVGLCQIMPATARDFIGSNRTLNLRDAKNSADLGARTMRRAIALWIAPRSSECRLELAWATYNAGGQHIIDAQTLSGGRRCWKGISPHLHKITGRHAEETRGYVPSIWSAWRKLRGFTI